MVDTTDGAVKKFESQTKRLQSELKPSSEDDEFTDLQSGQISMTEKRRQKEIARRDRSLQKFLDKHGDKPRLTKRQAAAKITHHMLETERRALLRQ